jgi:predicted amidophosphoribosyltransferase
MIFDVKNTTTRRLFELFCPHYCLLCGKLGSIVCMECKIYNIEGHADKCLKCGAMKKEICKTCRLPYGRGWAVGGRDDGLGMLIDGLKYESTRALAWPMAEMINAVLPCSFESDVVVVPVPTIARHVRARGLDHTWLVAKKLAKIRGWSCKKLVRRITNTVQVGADAERRHVQAKEAYELAGEVNKVTDYLVVDDVCTTGASLEAVCRILRSGGAKNISVVVLAKSGD